MVVTPYYNVKAAAPGFGQTVFSFFKKAADQKGGQVDAFEHQVSGFESRRRRADPVQDPVKGGAVQLHTQI